MYGDRRLVIMGDWNQHPHHRKASVLKLMLGEEKREETTTWALRRAS